MKRKKVIGLSVFLIVVTITMILITTNSLENKENIFPIEGTISAGDNHTVAIKQDGTVIATGSNFYGQSDVNDWESVVQVSAGTDYTLGLKKDGTVVATGNNSNGKCEVSDWEDVIYVFAGRYPVGLTRSGKIITTSNYIQQEYDIDSFENITYVSMDKAGSIFLITDTGEVICLFEEFATNDKTSKFLKSLDKPITVQSTGLFNAALFENGDLFVKDVVSTFAIGSKKYTNIVQYDIGYDLVGMIDKNGNVKILNDFAQNIFFNKFKMKRKNGMKSFQFV